MKKYLVVVDETTTDEKVIADFKHSHMRWYIGKAGDILLARTNTNGNIGDAELTKEEIDTVRGSLIYSGYDRRADAQRVATNSQKRMTNLNLFSKWQSTYSVLEVEI